ncbi:hypothetical protein [Bacteroides acidifaciens]|nr:hypothetical protein [Bacteroides acidifaciens]
MGEDYRGSRTEEKAGGRAAAAKAGHTETGYEKVTVSGGLPEIVVL